MSYQHICTGEICILWIKMWKYCFLGLIVGSALTGTSIRGQDDQTEFISIDCGIADGSHYTDPTTGIIYSSDAGFVDCGVSKSISVKYQTNSLERQFLYLRSFPQGTRNCYTLRPAQGKGNKYLIRTSFMYGNYDSRSELPTFDLHLGVDLWDTVTLENESTPLRKEIVHIPSSDYINVCLVKRGSTTPFISGLELRPLTRIMYTTENKTLQLTARLNFAPTSERFIRYKDDIYDRIWMPSTPANSTTIRTSYTIYNPNDYFRPPSAVMSSAIIPENNNDSISFDWVSDNLNDVFYMCLYFAELQELQKNEYRGFNISVNRVSWHGLVSPTYLSSHVIYANKWYTVTGRSKYVVTLDRVANSTLPPIISAVEIYAVKDFSHSQTDEKDVDAILSIKSVYGLTRNWQGDPCAPETFIWDGLSCKYNDVQTPRIQSLNLSFGGLIGIIAPYISNLTMLEVLDLSNNNLTGKVPEFLAELDSLKVLNLKGNNFCGPTPDQLLKKSNDRLLSLSIDYPSNCTDAWQSPCKKKSNSALVTTLASVLVSAFVLLIVLVTLWVIRRRRKMVMRKTGANFSRLNGTALDIKNPQFTYSYSEVLKITNNFQKVIGEGGFGTVYHGFVDATQVAVKMLSPSSSQGYKEFLAEAKLLLSVHHKNLTSFVGYCNENNVIGIIYEYMANGNLEQYLSDRNPHALCWEERLKIAIDAAQGLEYLHHGCKPPIVHRDVKTTNILLDENFQAKLADFGLSRAFLSEDHTHISTIVVGTPGYLDPEYYSSSQMSEKSDVYSFGIVLLEIVTGRPAVEKSKERTHLIQWIRAMLPGGDIQSIADPKLQGEFAVSSVWKVVELAMVCVSRNSVRRPNMTYVVVELKECLALEMTDHETQSKVSVDMIPVSLESRFDPQER